MKKQVIHIRVPQKAPRTRVVLKPKKQEVSRKLYKRDKSWKKETN